MSDNRVMLLHKEYSSFTKEVYWHSLLQSNFCKCVSYKRRRMTNAATLLPLSLHGELHRTETEQIRRIQLLLKIELPR